MGGKIKLLLLTVFAAVQLMGHNAGYEMSVLDECDTVLDTQAPVLFGVPGDTIVSCDAIPLAAAVTATDNCTASPVVSFSEMTSPLGCTYTITRTWTATDDLGNQAIQSQLITVIDTVPPGLTGVPADTTVTCGNVPTPPFTGAFDNCSPVPGVTFGQENVPGCPRVIKRYWTAVDDCGNVTTDTQYISLLDTVPPVLFGAPTNDITLNCSDDLPAPPSVIGTDFCILSLPVTFTETVDSSACPVIVTRSWSASDPCGNTANVVQLIIFEDTTPPVLEAAPADTAITCGDSIPAPALLAVSDNCDADVPVLVSDTLVDYFGVGDCEYTILRSWTATDDCGNEVSATQEISILPPSGTPPVASNDFTTICIGATVVYDVLANDFDPDGSLDFASLTISSASVPGTATANLDGTITYTHDGSTPAPIAINYQIADNDGLLATATLEVFLFDLPAIAATVVDASCGISNGVIDLSVSGGTSPYSYSWSNGASSQDISGLSGGNYSVSVSDFNGCVSVASYLVEEIGKISLAELTTFPASSCITNDGSVLVDLVDTEAGQPPYSVEINNLVTFGPFASEPILLFGAPGSARILNLRVTDANGCEFVETGVFPIGEPSPPIIESITANDPSCAVSTTGSIVIDLVDSLAGGPTYFVRLSSDIYGPFFSEPLTIDNLPPGSYQRPRIRDGNGCVGGKDSTFLINACPPLRADFAPSSGLQRSVWPNPSSGFVQLTLELDKVAEVSLELINAAGQSVLSLEYGNESSISDELDLSMLPKGVYTLRWSIGDKHYSDKVVLN